MAYIQKEMIRLFKSAVVKAECERRNLHQIAATIPPAQIVKVVPFDYVAQKLPQTYKLPNDPQVYYTRKYLLDTQYRLTTVEEIKRFLKWNLVNKDNYVGDFYDCDNFSISLHADCLRWTTGLAFGHYHTIGHAKNLVLCADDIVYDIEPQSDKIEPLVNPCTFYEM